MKGIPLDYSFTPFVTHEHFSSVSANLLLLGTSL